MICRRLSRVVGVGGTIRSIATVGGFRAAPPSDAQIAQFNETGFLQVDAVFPIDTVDRVVRCIDDVFVGNQETGIYPDEWYYRWGYRVWAGGGRS